MSLPVPQIGLSLLAVSTAGYGIRVYDGKHHVDTLKIMEPVSAMKVNYKYYYECYFPKLNPNNIKILYFSFQNSTVKWAKKNVRWQWSPWEADSV